MTDHIKVYGVKPRIQYVANGTSTVYDFPFVIFDASDVDVYLNDTKQASTSFTVSGARDSDGGTVTFATAPASGTVISIVRNLSIERTSDFQEGGALRADVLNDELDYQIACQQQIAENLNRSMVLPPYAVDSGVNLTLPMPAAGKAIVWNSDGTNLENSTVSVNALESTLKGYKETAESAASTATTKAGIASDKADIATTKAQLASDKADIATAKAAEATNTLASKANKDMDNLSATGKTTITSYGVPDYSAGTSVSSGVFTPNVNGVLVMVGDNNAGKNFHIYLGNNNTGVDILYASITGSQGGNTWFIPMKKDTSYYISQVLSRCTFYPYLGGI